jgi:CRISPR/Cas system CSM-associated protein Csm5 (group 7 of RAMP superfamily)
MSNLEQKLEDIEKKVKKLVEQNTKYQQVCADLLNVRRQLEKEIAELKNNLKEQAEKAEPVVQDKKQLKITYQDTNEGLEKRIDQYIQDIDTSIEWLKQL